MFLAIAFTILPTLYVYTILSRHIKSFLLKLSFSWLLGQCILGTFTYILAVIFSFFNIDTVLYKASIVFFSLLLLTFAFLFKNIFMLIKNPIKFSLLQFFLLLIAFLFSYFFYNHHLELKYGYIFTSSVYWDFKWNAPVIQNFVYGDNFPPQNEAFAGVPATYHFLWFLLVAIYSATGLDLVFGMNGLGIIGLFFLITAIIGLGEELFKSTKIGILAVLLTITSSSLRFISYFKNMENHNIFQITKSILLNTEHPYFFSFVSGNPFGYNGTMFNMYYFLAERQLVFGVIFLIFFIWLVYSREKISNFHLSVIGALVGMFFLWHLYITIMIFVSLLFLLVFDKDKHKTLYLLLPFGFVFLLHVLYFKSLLSSVWFYPDVGHFPKINFNFPTMEGKYPFSIINAIGYYMYAYGFKLIFIALSIFFLRKKNKKLLITFLSVIVPTFVLINTVQLSPLTIYDNHKWLRSMNVVVDFLVAFAVYKVMIYRKGKLYIFVGIVSIILITLSGFIELTPYFNPLKRNVYVGYASPLIISIRNNTDSRSVFLAREYSREVQMAGRKLFLGIYAGQDFRLKKDLRYKIETDIYLSKSLDNVCILAKKYGIDYIEGMPFKSRSVVKNSVLLNIDQIDSVISFLDVKESCNKIGIE